MRKEKETTLNGKRIKVIQLGFEEGMDLLVLLTKTLGPSLGTLATDPKQITPALSEFAKQLNTNDFKYVVNTLAKNTRINREGDKWPLLIDPNQRRGEAKRFKEITNVERVNARLKDDFGGRKVRVRGHAKVMAHLMFGILALTVDQLMRFVT